MDPSKMHKTKRQELRSSATFVTGALAGAATSTLVPWETFEGMAPQIRLASVAALCAAFVLLRVVFAGSGARKATAIVMVSVGGLLLSGGAKVLPGSLAATPVVVGATLFLFGVTLLMRERGPSREVREAAVGRLLEDSNQNVKHEDEADDVNTTASIERLRALALLSETDPKSMSGTVRVQ